MVNFQVIEKINTAIGAHGKWKFNLKMNITHNKGDFEVEKVKVDNLCEFGKWLHSEELNDDIKQGKPYEVITRLHKEFHICAGEVLQLSIANKKNMADELLEGEFTERSEKLVRALNKWKSELQD